MVFLFAAKVSSPKNPIIKAGLYLNEGHVASMLRL